MFRFRPGRPSPALIISFIALLVALGGTSYAAIALPRNSVGTKQLKKNAVTTAKIKNRAVTGPKMNFTGVTVPNANHATSANTAGSAAIGASPAAWAQVAASGTVTAGRGIASSNVHAEGFGVYCFTGLSFPFRSGQVTVDLFGGTPHYSDVWQFTVGNPSGYCGVSGTQAIVHTADANGDSSENAGFFVAFYN